MINICTCRADTEYIIGLGDVVRIDFVGARYMTANFTIDNNGFISLPKYGKYYIENKSINVAENELTKLYLKSLVNPEIKVFLIKSYKDEQNGQNKEFTDKLEIIKTHYLSRDYEKTINETRNLLDLLMKINNRDNKVKGVPKLNLEISDFSFNFSGEKNNIYEVKGKLKNNSNNKHNWVKSKLKFISESGKILNVKEYYLVKDLPIHETQIISIESKGIAPQDAAKIEIEITDYMIYNGDSE